VDFNGTHQLLVYTDDVNILVKNISTKNKNTEALLEASREVGLKAEAERTMYTINICGQNADKIIIYLLLINPWKM
jgi:hypothetical protein